MFLRAARVAPKKAVFRPALPMRLLPGMTEMRMAKSYFEKLKDPRWQKKRLEALEAILGPNMASFRSMVRQFIKAHTLAEGTNA